MMYHPILLVNDVPLSEIKILGRLNDKNMLRRQSIVAMVLQDDLV